MHESLLNPVKPLQHVTHLVSYRMRVECCQVLIHFNMNLNMEFVADVVRP